MWSWVENISPCFGKGSGLKLKSTAAFAVADSISPCFGKGSGLKLLPSRR